APAGKALSIFLPSPSHGACLWEKDRKYLQQLARPARRMAISSILPRLRSGVGGFLLFLGPIRIAEKKPHLGLPRIAGREEMNELARLLIYATGLYLGPFILAAFLQIRY
ncbi:MAG TPA: hypothetical protein VHT31_00700, partial [Candidatus Acidoferrum sp.]|nr:hypothetical protein [Candidatus Acidoferrum sp.]